MSGYRFPIKTLLLLMVIFSTILSACQAAAPVVVAPTAAPATATAQPSPTPLPPTATTIPSATPTLEPSPTPVPPTATATPIPADQVLTSWCFPKDKAMIIKAGDDPATMPEGALPGKLENGVLGMVTPAISCTFILNTGQPVKDGTILQVRDGLDQVWLKANFTPSPKNPNLSYAVLTHAYIVEPPYWSIVYKVEVLDPAGASLWTGKIDMHRGWMPAKCWDGTLPNIKTLYCKKQQDLHPWDPAYTPPPRKTP